MRIAGSQWFACPNTVFGHGLSAQEIVVLVYLYRRAGADGDSWPSYATVAEDCGVSRRTAIRVVASLQQRGLVTAEHRLNGGGPDQTSNLYRLQCPTDTGSACKAPPQCRTDTTPSVSVAPEVHSVEVPLIEHQRTTLPAVVADTFGPKELATLWNAMVPAPKVGMLGKTRLAHAKQRLAEHPDATWWRAVVDQLLRTPFLQGAGDRRWRADFDWLVRNDENAVKVLEGKYDDGNPSAAKAHKVRQALKGWADRTYVP